MGSNMRGTRRPGSVSSLCRAASLWTLLFIALGSSFALAQVKPGDFVTASDAHKVRNLVSPGVYLRVLGGMSMKIVAGGRVEWPPPYREATEKYAPQVRLSTDGRSLVGYVAGEPFPFVDPNDPDAGTKIMWNNMFRPTSTDDYDVRDFACISEYAGLNRLYRPIDYFEIGHLASYNLVGRTEVEPIPVDRDFLHTGRYALTAFYPFLAPEQDRGRGFIRYRYANPAKGDDVWWWMPGMRKLRRVNEAFLGSAAGAITWGPDNFQGFAAKNENYNWRFLGEKNMLACVEAANVPEVTCRTDGGASACPENWELRHVYIVQGVARRDRISEELYSRHILYVDSEETHIVYQDLYDRNGESGRIMCDGRRTAIGLPRTRELPYIHSSACFRSRPVSRTSRPGLRQYAIRLRPRPSSETPGTSTWAPWTRASLRPRRWWRQRGRCFWAAPRELFRCELRSDARRSFDESL